VELPNKNYILEAYGEAVAIELDNLFDRYDCNITISYNKQNIIIVYCSHIFKNRKAPRVVYVPTCYKEFTLNLYKSQKKYR
jgi:hypothetical protein